jgi:hypothetical protein
VHFIRVEGIESAHVPQLLEIKNLKIISKDKFQETLNIQ